MKRARASVFALLVLLGCREPLAHDLSEMQANRVIAGLYREAIEVQKQRQSDGRFSLSVPKNQLIEAIEQIKSLRLLREVAPEAAASSGIVPDRNLQRQQYEHNLSRDIEFTLSRIGGVMESRVHLFLTPADPLFGAALEPQKKGSAAVVLITDSFFSATRADIAALVAGAAGLDRASISVFVTHNVPEQGGKNASNLLIPDKNEVPSDLIRFVSERIAAFFSVPPSAYLLLFGLCLLTPTCLLFRLRGTKNETEISRLIDKFEQGGAGV